MTHHLNHKWFFYLLTILLLTACGGGGDPSVDISPGGAVTQGIAVDPYIEGAVFQEIDADTGDFLQESSTSNEFGQFTFPQPLTPGSVVEMKISNKGLHGGAPYQGMLRRVVTADDEDPMVVSPLTTLLANGITPEELIAIFHDAGLSGLTISDLYADPMEGLAAITSGVTAQDLKRLLASMSANAYMEVTGNFQAEVDELNDSGHFEILSTMINSLENLLNSVEFETISAALESDPDVTTPVILEDFILAVLAQQRTIIAGAQEDMASNGNFNQTLVGQTVQEAMNNSVADVKSYYSLRVPPSTTHDGVLLYHDNCSSCHQPLDITTKPGRSADDIQTAIDNNVGSMGILGNLTQGEIAAIADTILPASPPVVDPPASVDGATLYGFSCAGCHNPLDTTNKPGRSAVQIQDAIDGNMGGMGFLSNLTPDEVQAIADVLPAPPVVDPQSAAERDCPLQLKLCGLPPAAEYDHQTGPECVPNTGCY